MTPRDHAVSLVAQALTTGAADPAMVGRLLVSATVTDPSYAPAWFHLGEGIAQTGALEAACVCFRRAIALEPNEVKYRVNLAYRTYWAGNPGECLVESHNALGLDPENSYAFINSSLAKTILGLTEESVTDARWAVVCADTHESRLALAFALLGNRQWFEGLREHEARFEHAVKWTQSLPMPCWKGDDEGTLLVISEQGIGDTLSFHRFVEAARMRCDHIELMVNPELVRLLTDTWKSYPDVTVRANSQPFPAADYWTTFMSLPYPLDLHDEEIEAAVDDNIYPKYNVPPFKRLGASLHVGICWSGNPDCAIEKFRRVPLSEFGRFGNLSEVALYSLQVGAASAELYSSGFSAFITDCAPLIRNVADTFGILRELDLVITSDTSVHHMCGVLGVPCWLLCSYQGVDFRIGRDPERTGILWYPAHRAFMQGPDAAWRPVMERVYDELAALSASVHNGALRCVAE